MKKIALKLSVVALFLVLFLGVNPIEAKAAPFTRATLRYDRMMQNTSSTLQLIIVPVTVATESKIIVNFGTATLSAGQSATTANIPSYAVGVPGTLTAVGAGTSIAISGLNDLVVGTTYAVNLSVGVTTGAAGAATDTITTLTAGTAPIDSTTVTSRYITNDQVVISANVPPTFTFVLSGNTDAFTTNLSSGAVSTTTGIGVSVTTNAAKGWTGWVKSTNTALSSVQTGESIGTSGVQGSVAPCVNGTDCYVLDVGVTAGTGAGALTADAGYAGNGTTTGGLLSTIYQPFATRTGKTNGDLVWLKAHATMIATKAAGSDYTDTWTIVGAGNF